MRDHTKAKCLVCGEVGDPHLAICLNCRKCCFGMVQAEKQRRTEPDVPRWLLEPATEERGDS